MLNKFNRGGVKLLIATNLLTLLVLAGVVKDSQYLAKWQIRLGLREKVEPDYWAVKGWENTLRSLGYKTDVVFFGNSITYFGDFSRVFPDKRVANLGYPGDNLDGMLRRVEAIKVLHPDKVFIMGGINDLKEMPLSTFTVKYTELVDSICRAVPDAQIYLQSILPVGDERQQTHGDNAKIMEANRLIQKLTETRQCRYIDLFGLYAIGDVMPDSLTRDGLHLCPDAYVRWYEAVRPLVQPVDSISLSEQKQ